MQQAKAKLIEALACVEAAFKSVPRKEMTGDEFDNAMLAAHYTVTVALGIVSALEDRPMRVPGAAG